jgi:hydroxymethylglutaryl-CoA lyase
MTNNKNDRVIITDVTLREYGQNIPAKYLHIFTPEIRVEIALRLIEAGIRHLEIFSCVHPRISPAMNKKILQKIAQDLGRINEAQLMSLVPNRAGYDIFRELGLGPDRYNYSMGIFFSAVEAHNIANLGRPLEDTIEEYTKIIKDAVYHNIRIMGYISAAFGYFEQKQGVFIQADVDEVNNYISLLFGLGVDTVTLSDLQGVANEERTREIFETILNKRRGCDIDRLGYHPHHVSGEAAIANTKIAYDLGIRRFDSSLGGTGGCITGAPGNQPTEMLVDFFTSLGIQTGVDKTKIAALKKMVQEKLYTKIPLDEARG